MANHPITIRGVLAPNKLDMTNHGNARVHAGDTVTWIVPPSTGITIRGIRPKPKSPNVFNPNPAPVGGSRNWRGTIDTGIGNYTEEDYLIDYTTSDGSFTHDPKIAVLPSPGPISGFFKLAVGIVLGLLAVFSVFLWSNSNKRN